MAGDAVQLMADDNTVITVTPRALTDTCKVAKFQPDVVRSEYLEGEARRRVQPLVDICLESLQKLEKSLS